MPAAHRPGLRVDSGLTIPKSELSWRFSRSSGPGGQGVNTADSRAELVWDVAGSAVLSPLQRERLLERLSSRVVDGVLTITASEHRAQLRNREAARARLAAGWPTLCGRRHRLDDRRVRVAVPRNGAWKRRSGAPTSSDCVAHRTTDHRGQLSRIPASRASSSSSGPSRVRSRRGPPTPGSPGRRCGPSYSTISVTGVRLVVLHVRMPDLRREERVLLP